MLYYLLILCLSSFSIQTSAQWTFTSGTKSINIPSDYTMPYPGGVIDHTIALDSENQLLYMFGGMGYDHTLLGIFRVNF